MLRNLKIVPLGLANHEISVMSCLWLFYIQDIWNVYYFLNQYIKYLSRYFIVFVRCCPQKYLIQNLHVSNSGAVNNVFSGLLNKLNLLLQALYTVIVCTCTVWKGFELMISHYENLCIPSAFSHLCEISTWLIDRKYLMVSTLYHLYGILKHNDLETVWFLWGMFW